MKRGRHFPPLKGIAGRWSQMSLHNEDKSQKIAAFLLALLISNNTPHYANTLLGILMSDDTKEQLFRKGFSE